jgi:sulfite reductase (NADPH) flavoprotein alpha-component
MKNMSEIAAADVAKSSNLLVIVSTWGDGEPPETATSFYKEFMAAETKLAGLQFSICALGDTSYEKFCQTGKDLDAKFEALGATRISARVDCDVDYEEAYATWLDTALTALAPTAVAAVSYAPAASEVAVEYGKKNPFPADTLDTVVLNGEGSHKETVHLEFSLASSGLSYEPGDALAVVPVNAPDTIKAILQAAKLTGNLKKSKLKMSAPRCLPMRCAKTTTSPRSLATVLTKLAEAADSTHSANSLRTTPRSASRTSTTAGKSYDAIQSNSRRMASRAAALVPAFSANSHRACIRSPPARSPITDEVHLTVAAVRYQTHGRERKGVCSTYLADLVKPGDIKSGLRPAEQEFPPARGWLQPVIMVGPGTGIAPFRAFVEHRAALGCHREKLAVHGRSALHSTISSISSNGRSILKERHSQPPRCQPSPATNRKKSMSNTACWSSAKDLYAWLEEGAHFYVCGDATRMARRCP